jgi:purine-nucleoside phosphorylase
VLAIVAGSGLGGLAGLMVVRRRVPFAAIDGVGNTTVAGHAGEVREGDIDGLPCLLVLGRRHLYEGDAAPMDRLIDHVAANGATTLLVTSAAGALRRSLRPGEIVVARDLVDRQNRRRATLGPAEPAPTSPSGRMMIDGPARRAFERAATAAGVAWQPGTLVCASGPAYETAAEVGSLQVADADVATMSAAPEVMAANRLGLPVLAVAVVTNPCTGIDSAVPSHQEVLDVAARAAHNLTRVIRQFIVIV